MTRSQILRLLRNGCNLAELAAWFGVPPMEMRVHVRGVELRLRRRFKANVRLAA
jgi:hypothetical protein